MPHFLELEIYTIEKKIMAANYRRNIVFIETRKIVEFSIKYNQYEFGIITNN